MIENFDDQGFAPLTSPQVRDFGNRILLSLAERHTDDLSWKKVSTERLTENQVEGRDLHFEANWDDDIEMYEYYIGISRFLPIDSEWTEEGIRNALNIMHDPEVAGESDDSERVQVVDTNEGSENVSTEVEQPEGFLAVEHDYRFYVPYGNFQASAIKTMVFSIYDEDREQIDAEIAYHHSAFVDEPAWPVELENLYRFGELALDAQRLEKSLSEVTIGDLVFILDSLKALYLVRADCRPLSRKVL